MRHLGGQAADTGDHLQAEDLWWQGLRRWMHAGYIPGIVAQLHLLPPETPTGQVVEAWIDELELSVLRPGEARLPHSAE